MLACAGANCPSGIISSAASILGAAVISPALCRDSTAPAYVLDDPLTSVLPAYIDSLKS